MKSLLLTLMPIALWAQITPPDYSNLPSYKSLKFAPLPELKIPQPTIFTLSNGMKVYLLEDHELPLVSGFALVRTGNLFDPPEKRGLADVTGAVIRAGGTKAKTGDQLDEELENIAASVESNIGENNATVSFSCLRENVAPVLASFHDVLTAPAFRQDKIDLTLTQYRSGIARRNDDPGGIATREFTSLVYGRDTSYGWNVEYETIDRIRRTDVVDFYSRYFFPKNISLAVYGDFSTADMKAKLETLFSGWNYERPPVPPFPSVDHKPEPGIFIADKADVTQTFFHAGHLGGLLKDKDYPVLQVAADILGSGFTSRLVQKVRTELGYAYEINGSWGAGFDHPGVFQIAGSTKSESTEETLRVVREQVELMRAKPVTDVELYTAKQTVLNGFVFLFDRPSKTLNRLLLYDYFGYPKDFIFQYQKAIAAVTKEDVLRVAKEYWKPENMTIVAVGNVKEFGKPLSALGLPIKPLDVTIPEPKKDTAKSDAASLEKGKALLRHVQVAVGGADKLAAVKDFTLAVDLTILAGGSNMKAKQRNSYVAPSNVRQEQELPFGKVIVFSDGKTGWIVGPQGNMPMPPPVLKQIQGATFRMFIPLLLSDGDVDRTVNYTGDGVLEISNTAGDIVKMKVDETTGLPLTETYQAATMGGPPALVVETFTDWRDVNGIKLPFHYVIEQGGKKFAEADVQEYKLNPGIHAEDLSKKP